jgi:1,4-alpha-glucan branching enzyme
MGHHSNKHLGALVHDNGVDFRVWAPFAKQVSLLQSLEFEWAETPMQSDSKGYWVIEDVEAEPGQLYKYRITAQDGTKLDKNDPYARQLTGSDNGSSVIVARDFEWEGEEAYVHTPRDQAIIYELHVGTFNKPDASTTGTFETAIEKLDYLASLGVNYVELMPVTSMANSYGWGYAPNHIFSVENTYGGRHGLLEFVKACHSKGIGVIIDVVYNHFFKETDLWQYDGWSENDRGGIYFYNDERGDTPWGGRPDYGRPEVRQFILDNVAMWFTEFKIDGMRADSTIYMRNSEGNNDKSDLDIPDAWSLMAEVTDLARKINPNALMIAEDNATNNGIVIPTEHGGMGFDAQWEVGFPHVIRDALGITKNESQPPLQGIEWELEHSYTGNAFDRVVFADSHDTAANGSARINEEITPGNAESVSARQRVLLASTLTLTAPGIPMLLQGQEFMQEGAFNEWKMLEWDKTEQFEGIVTAHQHLIDLRLNRHDNTRGLLGQQTEVLHRDDTNTVIAYVRKNEGGPRDDTVIISNFSNTELTDYELKLPYTGAWHVRFNSCWKGYSVDFQETDFKTAQVDENGTTRVTLAAFSVMILSTE